MPPALHDPTYWNMVQELMGLGWYRGGPGPDRDGQKIWGFREGHLIDADPNGITRWIPARNETAAMRCLLDELRPRTRRESRRRTRRG